MENEVVKLAASQGLYAALFVALLFYVLRNNEKREERLMACLDALSQQYEVLAKDIGTVKDDVDEIKDAVNQFKVK